MRFTLVLALLAGVLFAGCDTNDPAEPADPIEVEGVYDFTTFRFQPDRSGILPVNVLDTLVTDASFLQLAANNEFQLTYRFIGQTFADSPRGTFQATRDDGTIDVTLTPRTSDADAFEAILLGSGVTFRREVSVGDTLLVLEEQRTVDLAAYDDDRYGGIEPQPGTLSIRLVLR